MHVLSLATPSAMSLRAALACLNGSSSPAYRLPSLASRHSHYKEVHRVLSPWLHFPFASWPTYPGYSGPWIENKWIDHFQPRAKDTGLAQFTPFVPLFVPWIDIWRASGMTYPQAFVNALQKTLMPDQFLYVTVSQSDQGLPAGRWDWVHLFRSTLQLSSGGYGHVVLPLLGKQMQPLKHRTPMHARDLAASYMGSMSHAPHGMRARMVESLQRAAVRTNETTHTGFVRDFVDVMARSRLQLCPRGFGRAAFHVAKAVLLGLLPVYVYSDVPWLPYPKLIEQIVWQTSVGSAEDTFVGLLGLTPDQLEAREAAVLRWRHLFTFEGAMAQIDAFLHNDRAGHLACTALPPNFRGDRGRPANAPLTRPLYLS